MATADTPGQPQELRVRLAWPSDTADAPQPAQEALGTTPGEVAESVEQAIGALEHALLTRMDRAGNEMVDRTVEECRARLRQALDEIAEAADAVVIERRRLLEESAARWREEIDDRASALRGLLERAGRSALDDLEHAAASAVGELGTLSERRQSEISGTVEGHAQQLETAIERRIADITDSAPAWVDAMEQRAAERDRSLRARMRWLTRVAVLSLLTGAAGVAIAVVALVTSSG